MVAKLSKKCFDLVPKIPQGINRKVTQGDFIHLYNKSEEEQHKILSDLLNNRISRHNVKRCKVSRLNSLKTNIHKHFMVQYTVRLFNTKYLIEKCFLLFIAWKGDCNQGDGK